MLTRRACSGADSARRGRSARCEGGKIWRARFIDNGGRNERAWRYGLRRSEGCLGSGRGREFVSQIGFRKRDGV